jgi:hypothetical protein
MVHPNGLPNYYAGRPGPFGNPLKMIGECIYIDGSRRRGIMTDKWIFLTVGTPQLLQDMFRAMITDTFESLPITLDAKSMYDVNIWIKKMEMLNLEDLRGKNLYCFCGPEEKCHADVLLELANKPI